MIVYTTKYYSSSPVEVIADELENVGLEDFEVSPKISKTNITLSADLSNLKIYVPPKRVFNQDHYELEGYIRTLDPTNRPRYENESGYIIMYLPRPIRMKNYVGLVKTVIGMNGFCTILME
jgi:hypothetical protein